MVGSIVRLPRSRASDIPAYMMPAAHWSVYVLSQFQLLHLPSVLPAAQDIYIPVHMKERIGALHISTGPIHGCINSTVWPVHDSSTSIYQHEGLSQTHTQPFA